MQNPTDFTQGKILGPLLKFAFPVFMAMFLQSMYGAVDLLVVGQFSEAVQVSAASTGSQIMSTLSNMVTSFSMGLTVAVGQIIGQGKYEESGKAVGAGLCLFGVIGVLMGVLVPVLASPLAMVMNTPEEAFEATVGYVRICGIGLIVIIAYNLIGSIFRGIGDSKTPFLTVAIACIVNIAGDLLLVGVFRMGARGAALATVFAQLVSVIISLWIISRKPLPIPMKKEYIRFEKCYVKMIAKIGWPVALQQLLLGISFMVILAIVNHLGVVASASVGVAQKVCDFIMLVPSSFSQSLSAFVAQNIGAGKYARARQTLRCAILASLAVAVVMWWISFFHGELLSGIFTRDPEVLKASAEYLRAYAIDCLLTCFLFCFLGFYNGTGMTTFVMIQGVVSAFCIRAPLSYILSKIKPVSLFRIGLSIPCATIIQIILCLIWYKKTNCKFESFQNETKIPG